MNQIGDSAYGKCVLDIKFDVNADTLKGYIVSLSMNVNDVSYYCKTGFSFDSSDPNHPRCKRNCNFDSTHLTGNLQSGSDTNCECKLPN